MIVWVHCGPLRAQPTSYLSALEDEVWAHATNERFERPGNLLCLVFAGCAVHLDCLYTWQVPNLWREVQFHVGSLLRSLAETQAINSGARFSSWSKDKLLRVACPPFCYVRNGYLEQDPWSMSCSMCLKTNCFAGKEMTSRAQPLVQVCLEYGLTGILPLNDVFDLRYAYICSIVREKHCHDINFAAW